MAKVSLRSYNHEIEKLIDGANIEEAVAHSKYILQTYPKHMDTYRLLGKAYLENQRYGEATDIFLRVLASMPDDFVAHIGLSIIREDEGNLDAAIWHMERAYEVQPSNSAIQDELRRLYGRRDGLEPPRIRLTRGALVRMYARGDLYQQAIAEIHALLADEPQRPDVQALLARMYLLTGKKIEATEVCGELLNKYPYCFQANLILSEILPGTSRAEDAKIYHQRVVSLDPYLAFTSADHPDSAEIPDNAVMIDHLDWQSLEHAGYTQPKWAESLGLNLDDSGVKAMPEWMLPASQTQTQAPAPATPAETPTESEAASQPPEEAAQTPLPAPTPSENLIPDWMRHSGWTESTGEASEQGDLLAPSGQEEAEAEGGIKPGAIPDWLQALAPDVAGEEHPAAKDANFEQLFASAFPEPAAAGTASEKAAGLPPEAPSGEAEAPVIPAQAPQPQPEPASAILPAVEAASALAGAAEIKSAEAAVQPPAASLEENEAIPGWLREIGQEPAAQKAEPAPAPDLAAAPEGAAQPMEETALPDWIKDLVTPAEGEEGITVAPEERSSSISAWIQEAQAESTGNPEDETAAMKEEAPASEELPGQAPSLETPTAVAPEAVAPVEETTVGPGAVETVAPLPTEPAAAPAETEPVAAWMEQAEAEAPADAPTRPVTVRITPEAEPQAAAPVPEAMTPPGEGQPQAAGEDNLPEWLKGLGTAEGTAAVTQSREEPLPAWLSELEGKAPAQGSATPAEGEAPEASSIEEPSITPQGESLPDWLTELKGGEEKTTIVPAVEETTPAQPQAEMEVSAPAPEAVEPPAESAALEKGEAQPAGQGATFDEDAALAWLEGLAAKQGADEATLFIKPEARQEEAPGWIQQAMAQPEEAAASAHAPEEAPVAETPAEAPVEQAVAEAPVEEPAAAVPVEAAPEAPWEQVAAEAPAVTAAEAPVEVPAAVVPVEAAPEAPMEEAVAEAPAATTAEVPVEVAVAEAPAVTAAEAAVEEPAAAVPVETTPEAPVEQAAAEAPGESLPEWLKGFETEETKTPTQPIRVNFPTQTAETPEETPQPVAESPDWLESLTAEEAQPAGLPAAEEPPAPAPAPAAPVEPVAAAGAQDPQAILAQAQAALNGGQLSSALDGYTHLITSGSLVDETIHDLRDAVYQYPVEVNLWQTLGDAYVRTNRLQDALDAYSKAEELLR